LKNKGVGNKILKKKQKSLIDFILFSKLYFSVNIMTYLIFIIY